MLVVMLLVDGLGYNVLQRGGFWKRHSKKIRNIEPTITAPNFVSIMTGMLPKKHGVMTNEDLRAPLDVDNVLHLCDDHVLISDWRQMRHLLPSTAVPKDRNFRYRRTWAQLLDEIKQRRTSSTSDSPALPPTLLVMNTSSLDTAAHKHGIESKEAKSVIEYIDRRTEKVFDALQKTKREFVLIGVADHGFDGDDHEHPSSAVREVPLMIASNADIERPLFRSTLGIAPFIQQLISQTPDDDYES
jgi:predicted AlkP superfamily pyrophosphatase or phosphodiesterase